MPDTSVFAVKGERNTFFKKTFYSTVLSSNIAVYRYLADTVFDGDLGRIVWASNERTFRRRQEQITRRKNTNAGILDLPYCSFRLAQDGLENKAQNRPWFNQSLNVRGIWIEELGRKVRVTPVSLRYEGVICMQHDTDLFLMQQMLIWEASNETILSPVLETTSDSGATEEIKNIAVAALTPHMNTRFSEAEWLTNNKIQAIDFEIQLDTYILLDNRQGYWLTKASLLQFAVDALPGFSIRRHMNGDIEHIINTEIFA